MVKKKAKKVDEKQEAVSTKSKLKINPWMVATGVLALLLLINGLVAMTSGISKATAEKEFLEFTQAQGADVEVLEVKSVGDLYEITFDFQGQEGEFHISKDGKYVGQMMLLEPSQAPATGQAIDTPTQTQQPSAYSEEDQAKLLEFNTCLAQAGLVIYGSSTCPHCRNLATLLGGYSIASPVYVECSEQRERCNSEAKTGYVPEIQINGEIYEGGRTLQDFAQVTGCPTPNLS